MTSSVCLSSSGDCSRTSLMPLIFARSSLICRWMFFLSSSFSLIFLFFGLSCRSYASTSRCTERTLSTASFISSMRRRLTDSVNSIRRMACDSSTSARIAHRVDLLLHLPGALDDALVGDLFVVEDDQLADRALAGVQLIAEQDHFLRDERRSRNRLDDGELSALDPPRDLDFAFAREQRHRAHLAQVHADRVVGLVE